MIDPSTPFLQVADDDGDEQERPTSAGTGTSPTAPRRPPRIPTVPAGGGQPANTGNQATPTTSKPGEATPPAATAPAASSAPTAAPAQVERPAPPAQGAAPTSATPAPAGATGTTRPEPPASTAPQTPPAATGTNADSDGKPDTGMVTPLLSAATAVPSMFASMASGLMTPFMAMLQSLGEGQPASTPSSGLPPQVLSALNSINASDAGTSAPITAYDGDVSGKRSEAKAMDELERDLSGLIQQSGTNTTDSREKIKKIISSVQSQIQSLGPVANTAAGQAQIVQVITQGLTQAGTVMSQAALNDSSTASKIRTMAARYTGNANQGNKLTSSSESISTGAAPDSKLSSLTSSSSKEEVAAAIIAEARRRGYTPAQTIAILSTAMQESNLQMQHGGGGAWHGYFQQDTSYPNRDNPAGNINGFFDRLDQKVRSSGASSDIWKNIFWLQQRPGISTADVAYSGGRTAYLTEIQSQHSRAVAMYNSLVGVRA